MFVAGCVSAYFGQKKKIVNRILERLARPAFCGIAETAVAAYSRREDKREPVRAV